MSPRPAWKPLNRLSPLGEGRVIIYLFAFVLPATRSPGRSVRGGMFLGKSSLGPQAPEGRTALQTWCEQSHLGSITTSRPLAFPLSWPLPGCPACSCTCHQTLTVYLHRLLFHLKWSGRPAAWPVMASVIHSHAWASVTKSPFDVVSTDIPIPTVIEVLSYAICLEFVILRFTFKSDPF